MFDDTKTTPPADGRVVLALAEISNVLMALGITREPLSLEAQRVISYYFAQFVDRGTEMGSKQIRELQAELEQKRQQAHKLMMDNRDLQLQMYNLKEQLYKRKQGGAT